MITYDEAVERILNEDYELASRLENIEINIDLALIEMVRNQMPQLILSLPSSIPEFIVQYLGRKYRRGWNFHISKMDDYILKVSRR